MILSLALRELRNHRSFTLIFIANIALGLLGFLTLDSFKWALKDAVDGRARFMLAADIGVSARRPLTLAETKVVHDTLGPDAREGHVRELYSMLSGRGNSRLVQIKAIDHTFPFYGAIYLQNDRRASADDVRKLQASPIAWIYPELRSQLGLRVGDKFRVGEAEFTVADEVTLDDAASSAFAALAPRIYIGLPQLAPTNLIRPGSTATFSVLYRLPPGTDEEGLAKKLDRALPDPAVRVQTPKTVSEQLSRAARNFDDYLGLTALVAFFLASLGGVYLFRSYLSLHLKEIAVLRSLGFSRRSVERLYLCEIALLGTAAVIPAAAIAAVLLPAFTGLVSPVLPFPLKAHLSVTSCFIAALLAAFGNASVAYPLLLGLRRVSPSVLFQESGSPRLHLPWRQVTAFLPAVLFFSSLALWQSRSFLTAGLFLGCLFGAALLLSTAGFFTLRFADRFVVRLPLVPRFALRHLVRNPASTITCFLAIALGTLLINFLAQVQTSIRAEVTVPTQGALPSFFLFDIQEEQRPLLENFLRDSGAKATNVAPMIRARIASVNGQRFEKDLVRGEMATREAEADRSFRNRGVNLTFRDHLLASESIYAGEWFSQSSGKDEQAPISVEKDYAKRLDLKLGDKVVFDVQGIEVKSRIASIRKLHGVTFQPNFFVVFPNGFLEEAPKTFLAAIGAVPPEQRQQLQNAIAEKFSNVSLVDVTRLVDRILVVLEQMSWALRGMAYLVIVIGFALLFTIAHHQATLRKWEIALWKTVGAPFGQIRATIALEFAILGFAAAAFGILFSFGLSYAFAWLVFENTWVAAPGTSLASFIGITVGSAAVATLAVNGALKQSPADLFVSAH